jgi:hypothetical protein
MNGLLWDGHLCGDARLNFTVVDIANGAEARLAALSVLDWVHMNRAVPHRKNRFASAHIVHTLWLYV